MKIEKIDWSVKYSVANKELDEDHKKIIVLINKIVEYHNSNFYSDNITDICYELISYSYKHNEFEETILESLGYPDLKSLKEEHSIYKNELTEIIVKYTNAENKVSEPAISFLRDWWENHILNEDMKYKSFIQEQLN